MRIFKWRIHVRPAWVREIAQLVEENDHLNWQVKDLRQSGEELRTRAYTVESYVQRQLVVLRDAATLAQEHFLECRREASIAVGAGDEQLGLEWRVQGQRFLDVAAKISEAISISWTPPPAPPRAPKPTTEWEG